MIALIKWIGPIFLLINSMCLYCQQPFVHFTFNGNANDISGFNNHGRLIGNIVPTSDRFGNPCGALLFNGIDAFIEVPDSQLLRSPGNALSVTAWVRFERNISTINPDRKWLTLICKGDKIIETPDNPQYRVQFFQSKNQSTISLNTEITEYDYNFKQHEFEYGRWTFIALVYDGREISVFINNNKVWSYPYSNKLIMNNSPLHIAKDIPGATEYFSGAIDDLRIYNVALSDNQVLKLFNEFSPINISDDFALKCTPEYVVNSGINNCSAIVTFPDPDIEVYCGNVFLKQIKGMPSGSEFPVGISSIVYVAESSNGKRKACSFNIVVKDIEPPFLRCPKDTVIYINGNSDVVSCSYFYPMVEDNCIVDTIYLTNGLPSGSFFPIGRTINSFIAKDRSGNISTCNFFIDVVSVKSDIEDINIDESKISYATPDSIHVYNSESIDFTSSTDQIDSISNNIGQLKLKEDALLQMNIELANEYARKEIELKELEEQIERLKLQYSDQQSKLIDSNVLSDTIDEAFYIPLEVGAIAEVKNIFFNPNSSFLQKSSLIHLNSVAGFLNKNFNLIVEIGGHTNGHCDESFCNKLSYDRAKACVEYLITRGIDKSRLMYKGYGKTQLLFPSNPMSPLNQRVEIKILSLE